MLGRHKRGVFMLATIALVLMLGLSAYYKQASIPDAEISVRSKEPVEFSESVSTNNDLSDRIKQLVKDLEYPDKVAEDFTRMAMAWKDEQGQSILIRWKVKLINAHQDYQTGKSYRNHVARIEESVLQGLCERIRRQFNNNGLAFELSDIIENRQADCLGFSQLIYIVGNAVGLSVKPIDVLEHRSVEGNARERHITCIMDLFDGQVVMADMTWFYKVSLPFKLEDQFVKVGNYWELRDKDNPFELHKRIRLLDRRGLIAAIANNRGYVYVSKGEYEQAILEYNKVIEFDSGFTKAYNDRGNTYAKKGEFEQAILEYNKAIEIEPRYAMAYFNRGVIYAKKGEFNRAILDYTKAIEIDPRFAEAYYNRGRTYEDKGEDNRAILDFTKAIEINPKDAYAYTHRGSCYYKKDDYNRAILDFTKAIEIDPKDAYAYTIRGNIYYVKNEYDRAILDYDKAIEIDPEGAIPYRDRGAAYAELGKSEEATKDLLKALELDPELRESVKKVSEQYELDLKLD